VYARVATRKQREDLDRRAQRMTEFANAAGLSVVAVIKEARSGVSDTRPKLTAMLKEDSWGTLVVEHQDRLSRVGFGWFDVLLGVQGRRIVVADAATEDNADLLEDFVSLIYSCAAGLYGVRSARRRTDEVIVALDIDPKTCGATSVIG
jgi:predicted site-specific integrase-resolvase